MTRILRICTDKNLTPKTPKAPNIFIRKKSVLSLCKSVAKKRTRMTRILRICTDKIDRINRIDRKKQNFVS